MTTIVRALERLPIPLTMVKFAMVGGLGMCIRMAGMYILVDIANVNYMMAYAMLFVVVMSNNYVLNSLWTFPDKAKSFLGFLKYCGVGLVALGVSQTVLYLLTDLAGLWYMISTMVAVISGFLVNFTISKKWVWAKDKAL